MGGVMMIVQWIAGYISCVGFGILFNCPKKSLAYASLSGSFGWLAYIYTARVLNLGTVVGSLVGSLVLSFFCELLARVKKNAITVFTIPAILPLVPGASLYRSLSYLVTGDTTLAFNYLIITLECALAIGIGIILMSSIYKVLSIVTSKHR